jgi:hypothetical protein
MRTGRPSPRLDNNWPACLIHHTLPPNSKVQTLRASLVLCQISLERWGGPGRCRAAHTATHQERRPPDESSHWKFDRAPAKAKLARRLRFMLIILKKNRNQKSSPSQENRPSLFLVCRLCGRRFRSERSTPRRFRSQSPTWERQKRRSPVPGPAWHAEPANRNTDSPSPRDSVRRSCLACYSGCANVIVVPRSELSTKWRAISQFPGKRSPTRDQATGEIRARCAHFRLTRSRRSLLKC